MCTYQLWKMGPFQTKGTQTDLLYSHVYISMEDFLKPRQGQDGITSRQKAHRKTYFIFLQFGTLHPIGKGTEIFKAPLLTFLRLYNYLCIFPSAPQLWALPQTKQSLQFPNQQTSAHSWVRKHTKDSLPSTFVSLYSHGACRHGLNFGTQSIKA